jgi:hypothetical protein
MHKTIHAQRQSSVLGLPALGLAAVLGLCCCALGMRANDADSALLATGERALIGTYHLDNVLLAAGKLVMLDPGNSMFPGMGETPQQAVEKRMLTQKQSATLQSTHCSMDILTNHTFIISNLPTADLTQVTSVSGTWSLTVYHAFDAYGYRIHLVDQHAKKELLRVRFYNADKPNPAVLEVFDPKAGKNAVTFRFAK